jgi:Co/Zn/Cd efflux system component
MILVFPHHDQRFASSYLFFTQHVFADTLRSIAVIVASSLAEFVPSITSEVADAGAAVVVSILIVLSLVPLVGGMVKTFKALRDVNQQLRKERFQHLEVGGDIQFQDDDFDDDVSR